MTDELKATGPMNCLFGLFDILGYKNFCEHCGEVESAAVFKNVDELEISLPASLEEQLGSKSSNLESVVKQMKWLTFSDTILLAMPVTSESNELRCIDASVFLLTCMFINDEMFELGLPVKGCIHKGEILLGKRGYGGKAIVEAYEMPTQLVVAASIITDKALEYINDTIPEEDSLAPIRDSVAHFELPNKRGGLQTVPTLNWFNLRSESRPKIDNIRSFIQQKFTAHGKTMNDGATIYANNTERLFAHWKSLEAKEELSTA